MQLQENDIAFYRNIIIITSDIRKSKLMEPIWRRIIRYRKMEKRKISSKKRKKQLSSKKKWYRKGAWVFGLLFLGTVLFIGIHIGRQRQAEKKYEAMRTTVVQSVEEITEQQNIGTEETVENTEMKSDAPHLSNTVDFDKLHQENEDIYAWIQIPGTLVDYPVLQHPTDDSYYLDHTVERVSGLPGSIYTESIHPKDFSAPMTVMYGHNMRNDTMFGSLHDYETPGKLEESPYIYIYLPDRTLVYQIFAAVRFSDAYLPQYCNYEEEAEFQAFTEALRASDGNVNDEVETPYGSRLLILSTCIGNAPSNRYLVAAVQIDEYE